MISRILKNGFYFLLVRENNILIDSCDLFILLFYIFINFPSTKVAVVCRNVIVQQCESLRNTPQDRKYTGRKL